MIVFIPIKENSQRVPGKNFRDFNGKMLFSYVVDNLLSLDFDIYIDTDSDIVSQYYVDNKQVKVIKRKENLMGDDVSVIELIKSFINEYNINDYICQTHVTSPLLETHTIKNAITYLDKYESVTGCDILFNRLWKKSIGGYEPVNHNPDELKQTQDLDPLYLENSSFYIFHSSNLLKTNKRISSNNYFYEVKYPQNLDIDNESDWDLIKKFE